MKKEGLKYRINAILSELPSSVRKIKIQRLKNELKIKRSRLGNIRTAKMDSGIYLKDWQLLKAAEILDVSPQEILNQ